MKTIALKYAFIVFIITVVWTLIEHVLGYNTTKHEIGQYTRLITSFVYYAFVVLAILQVRKHQGKLSFGEGLKTGTITAVVYSILVTGWFALYAEVINPQYQPTLIAFERSKLEAAHTAPAEIAEKLKQIEMESGGSLTSYLLLFCFMFLFGFVVAILASLILKQKKTTA